MKRIAARIGAIPVLAPMVQTLGGALFGSSFPAGFDGRRIGGDASMKDFIGRDFSPAEIKAFYKVVFNRRDVRRFLPEPVPLAALERVLLAAHHAPSVGFMQPWNFILVRSSRKKRQVKKAFLQARAREAERFSGDRKKLYLSFKLEGIEEAPINICVTCDSTRHGPAVLGRTFLPEADLYSTCCAIQNLWLAARAEGLGVGWVSIVSQNRLRKILDLPSHVVPVAYLSVGYAERFESKPELEKAGWLSRLELQDLVYYESWGKKECPWKKRLFSSPAARARARADTPKNALARPARDGFTSPRRKRRTERWNSG